MSPEFWQASLSQGKVFARWLLASNCLHPLNCGGPFFHQYPVTTIRTSNTTVLVVDFNRHLTPSTFIGHLILLHRLLDRSSYRTTCRGERNVGTSGEGISTFGTLPDGGTIPLYFCSSAPRAVVFTLAFLFNICNKLPDLSAIPRPKSTRRSSLSALLELLDHDYTSRNFPRIPFPISHAISAIW